MLSQLFILGSSSAIPTKNRNPSAQLLTIKNELILIDCGEGTQQQILKYGLKSSQIDTICISHLHGDHYFGLPGLISTMNLLGREKALNLIGPPALKTILDLQFENGNMELKFEINFFATNPSQKELIFTNPKFTIHTFPLKHRIHTCGFLISETENEKHLNIKEVEKHQIPIVYYRSLKLGNDFETSDGIIIPNSELTFEPSKPCSYAYCSDTIFDIEIVSYIESATVLYHEATYLQEMQDKARQRFHSTALEAATIAQKANVGKLLLGHFSSRYTDLNEFIIEAKQVFENTELALEGSIFELKITETVCC